MADDGSITAGDMSAAFSAAEGASPTPDPSPVDTTAVAASADATVPPADPAIGEVTSTSGVPPEQRWPSILENARKEAAARAEEAWKPYEWAKQVNPDEYREVAGWHQRAKADPVAFAEEFIRDLQQHPVYGQQLRSLAGRQLAAMRGQQPSQEPQPDLQLEDGRFVYSQEQSAKRDAWKQQQAFEQFEQKYRPVFQTVEELRAERQEAKAVAAADKFATGLTGSLIKLPGFNEHKAEIAEYIAKAKLESDHPSEVRAAAFEAYTAIVVPKLSTMERQNVLSDLHHKAGATTVNPAHASTAAPKSLADMTTKEALQAEFARMSG